MDARARVPALVGALALLVVLDVVIARVDVFTPLLSSTRPTTLFAGITYQLTEVVGRLYGRTAEPRPVVVLGTSQMAAAITPVRGLRERLVAAGAPAGTDVVPLCVFGTAPTDAEVLARNLGPVRPGLVLHGIGVPDVGTTLERAREMPVTRTLDVGWRDGLVPPADLEARLDRWVRTAWRLYRYRVLFRDLLLPPDEPRTPDTFRDDFRTVRELFENTFGPARATTLLALRAGFERGDSYDDVVRYLTALSGPEYLPGLRTRWRDVVAQPIQLEALRRAAEHERRAGGRPAWVLLPENPLLARDPEVGAEVRARSDAVAAAIAALADRIGVPLIDLRHALPAAAFGDMNHILYNHGDLMDPLAAALAARGLLAG